MAGHLWDEAAQNWGYGGLAQQGELLERYKESAKRLQQLKARGVAAGCADGPVCSSAKSLFHRFVRAAVTALSS